MIAVVLIDHPDSGANGTDLVAIAHALEIQIQRDVCPVYGVTCTVGVSNVPVPGAWTIGLFRDADQPQALGYHDETPDGLPLAKVFPLLDAQDGANLSTTISHELIEMLVDPYLTGAVMGSDGKFWANEACDPCENEEYEIGGVKVSDFALPGWFGGKGKCDYLGKIATPLTVLPGGYAQSFDAAKGWQMITHADKAPRRYRQMVPGRTTRRRIR